MWKPLEYISCDIKFKYEIWWSDESLVHVSVEAVDLAIVQQIVVKIIKFMNWNIEASLLNLSKNFFDHCF